MQPKEKKRNKIEKNAPDQPVSSTVPVSMVVASRPLNPSQLIHASADRRESDPAWLCTARKMSNTINLGQNATVKYANGYVAFQFSIASEACQPTRKRTTRHVILPRLVERK